MKRDRVFRLLLCFILICLLAAGGKLQAQGTSGTVKPFSQEQLERLLAPVALYPDSLLTQIFMASTYPLEVVKAMNWLKTNKDLKGDALKAALEKQNWEASVKSLVNFPQVLQMMSDQVDWTQKLGDAFLAQQKDVMDTVQKLRKKAQTQGNLKSSKEQKVTVVKDTQVIIIEPANPQIVYVPAYSPTVVYGTWWYPAPPVVVYPPPPPGYAAMTFATGVAVGAAWGYAWGSPNWHAAQINVYPPPPPPPPPHYGPGPQPPPPPPPQPPAKGQAPGQDGGGVWHHDPDHRQGVAYKDSATAQKFGQQTRPGSNFDGNSRGFGTDRAAQGKGQPGRGSDQASRVGKPAQTGNQTRSPDGSRVSAERQGGASDRGVSKSTGGSGRTGSGARDGAFSGVGNGGFERGAGARGSASRGGRRRG